MLTTATAFLSAIVLFFVFGLMAGAALLSHCVFFHDWGTWSDWKVTATGKAVQARHCNRCHRTQLVTL